jgi:flagellin
MSLSINNNITSLNAWRNLKQTDSRMSRTMEKLSSGLRINRAADDPAGLVISEKMRAQLVGLDAAVKNSEKAINMIQTTEAALDQVQKLLDKMRQLALDSANSGVNDSAMLNANQDELDEAIDSITRIANYTQFGTKKVLDGTLGTTVDTSTGASTFTDELSSASFKGISETDKSGTVSINVTDQAEKASVSVVAYTATTISSGGTLVKSVAFTINGVTVSVASGTSMANAANSINGYSDATGVTASWDTGSNTLTLSTTRYGSDKYVAFSQNTATTTTMIATAATSTSDFGEDYQATVTYADGDTSVFDQGTGLTMVDSLDNTIVLEDADLTTANGSLTMGTLDVNEAKFQVGANENQTITITVQSVKAVHLGSGATYGDAEDSVTLFASLERLKSGQAYTNGVFVDGSGDAIAQAIGVVDKALDEISSVRGQLGAIQSDNLQVQLDALRVSYENLQAAEAGIRDTDMTLEMAQFTKYQIMMQAGTAMLAQANQIPNNVLQLLR